LLECSYADSGLADGSDSSDERAKHPRGVALSDGAFDKLLEGVYEELISKGLHRGNGGSLFQKSTTTPPIKSSADVTAVSGSAEQPVSHCGGHHQDMMVSARDNNAVLVCRPSTVTQPTLIDDAGRDRSEAGTVGDSCLVRLVPHANSAELRSGIVDVTTQPDMGLSSCDDGHRRSLTARHVGSEYTEVKQLQAAGGYAVGVGSDDSLDAGVVRSGTLADQHRQPQRDRDAVSQEVNVGCWGPTVVIAP
jgi:hypothetical protein